MNSTGIVRRLDQLGRIVIPKEIRTTFDIKEDDPVEIFVDGKNIVLRKYENSCVFCGEANDVIEVEGKCICKECLEKIKQL